MTAQMQTISARIPAEDLEWLSALELPGAVTPSDKLRMLIAQMRRQHEGSLDYAACLAWLRDLLNPFVLGIRAMEHRQRVHSEAIDAIAQWIPQIMALLLSEAPPAEDGATWARDVEEALVQRCFRLAIALLRLGVTPGAECYDAEVIDKQLPRVLELAELIAEHREPAQEKRS